MTGLVLDRVQVGELSREFRNEIDSFIEQHFGTVFHESSFNEISAKTFGTELSYYLARLQGRLAGVCPCHLVKDRYLLHTFSNLTSQDLAYGGWVYDEQVTSIDQLVKGMKVNFNESIHFSSNIEIDLGRPFLPSYARTYTIAQTAVIDLLGKDADTLFESFKHSQKNKIRKALKNGVLIKHGDPEHIDQFYELLADLKEQVGKSYVSREYFQDVFAKYHQHGRAACLIAEYEGENISTLIMLANKAFATIWMGGRKMGIPKNLYQNELMIWEAIKWSLDFGSEYFDLCIVDETRYPNLARMKLSFSKNLKPLYFFSKKHPCFRVLKRLQVLLH